MSNDIAEQSSPSFLDGWSQVFADPDIHETGGEHVNEGIDFARYWAISAVVSRELAGDADYVILFEYLQDVAILNTTLNPTTAVLYQIKKKERGGWTRAELCKKESISTGAAGSAAVTKKKQKANKLTGNSPLGKLYLCVDRLSSHVSSASGVFLSNAAISLRLTNGELIPSYSSTTLPALLSKDFAHIEKTIASELGMTPPLSRCQALLLEQTMISPAAMRETIRGVVADYLHQIHPNVPNVSGQLVERLFDSFSKRSGPKPTLKTLGDIVEHKGFTRLHFTEIIGQLSSVQAHATRLDQIVDSLQAEGVQSRLLTKIRQSTVRLQTQLVRHPQSRDSLNWDAAVEAAGETDTEGEYKTAMAYITDRLKLSFTQRGMQKPSEVDLQSISILAIIYVEEPTPPSAQPQD